MDRFGTLPEGTTYCDLTQSWSSRGGGVGTYIRRKRRHILDHSAHRHLMIIPGDADRTIVEEGGRAITVTIASPNVPRNPYYRLLLRNGAVRAALEEHRPDLIECQDAYNLPWAAVAHRRRHPATALVAAYCTDFPTVYVRPVVARMLGAPLGSLASRICYAYAGSLYRRFDAVFAMSENGGASRLRELGVDEVSVVPLGAELGEFSPEKRCPKLRESLGVADDEPVIIYAGRFDSEKRPDIVADAFLQLPAEMRATLVLLGEGPTRPEVQAKLAGARAFLPGFVRDRSDLARWLASADVYASAMAHETFGISIIEAQASGLPVVGVAGGAMLDRVTEKTGRVGPVGDAAQMALNIAEVWNGERRAMAEASWHHAQQFSWQQSMDGLFGSLYPRALRRAAERAALGASRSAGLAQALR